MFERHTRVHLRLPGLAKRSCFAAGSQAAAARRLCRQVKGCRAARGQAGDLGVDRLVDHRRARPARRSDGDSTVPDLGILHCQPGQEVRPLLCLRGRGRLRPIQPCRRQVRPIHQQPGHMDLLPAPRRIQFQAVHQAGNTVEDRQKSRRRQGHMLQQKMT